MTDWKIGEIRQIDGEWYQCLEREGCSECAFNKHIMCEKIKRVRGECLKSKRKDRKSAIFKKLEKVGEPFELLIDTNKKVLMQEYKIYGDMYIWENKGVLHTDCFNGIRIEIKEDKKEDMEIRKVVMNLDDRDYLLDRLEAILHDHHCQQYRDEICEALSKYIVTATAYGLKPFDLNAAKAGKPVCTRDGRKARIICFDAKGKQPIIALFEREKTDEEIIQTYNVDGSYYGFGKEDHRDLIMLTEKKEGWVNVYNRLGVVTFSHNPYDTKEEALEELKSASGRAYCVDTIKVEWEE